MAVTLSTHNQQVITPLCHLSHSHSELITDCMRVATLIVSFHDLVTFNPERPTAVWRRGLATAYAFYSTRSYCRNGQRAAVVLAQARVHASEKPRRYPPSVDRVGPEAAPCTRERAGLQSDPVAHARNAGADGVCNDRRRPASRDFGDWLCCCLFAARTLASYGPHSLAAR